MVGGVCGEDEAAGEAEDDPDDCGDDVCADKGAVHASNNSVTMQRVGRCFIGSIRTGRSRGGKPNLKASTLGNPERSDVECPGSVRINAMRGQHKIELIV